MQNNMYFNMDTPIQQQSAIGNDCPLPFNTPSAGSALFVYRDVNEIPQSAATMAQAPAKQRIHAPKKRVAVENKELCSGCVLDGRQRCERRKCETGRLLKCDACSAARRPCREYPNGDCRVVY